MIIGLTAAALLATLVLIITVRTVRFRTEIPIIENTGSSSPDMDAVIRHLQEATGFMTVSHSDPADTAWDEFRNLGSWIDRTYPLIAEHLTLTPINEFTRIYLWKGENPTLKPILLTAHQDVVPAGNEEMWAYPPFSGTVSEDGFIYGRGVFDMKLQMISILESVEHLLNSGFRPTHDIYLCFGHDEEVGGSQGAAQAASYFAERGIEFSVLLDEGGAVTDEMISGLNKAFGAIGIGEKGYLDAEIRCTQAGGHSSMPPRHTALGHIAKAVTRLEKKQFPTEFTSVPREMFAAIGPFFPLPFRIVLANLWLFKPLFLRMLSGGGASNAMIRTTTAATMASGSSAANVLAAEAKATVNLRLMTGTSSDDAVNRIQTVINDTGITVTKLLVNEPSKITPVSGKPYAILRDTVYQFFPECVVAPYLMLGGTDAIKYEALCDHILRFSPLRVHSDELKRVHSYNERVSLDNISTSVSFFVSIIGKFDSELDS